ncbi:hypothetical protein [Kineosporia sp. R_H_3]|uniref:hypothetical protein n=1 Tax=Kineosporia sp. R_H_3 TaxID=1961848 RepID=UPI001179A0FE|nr:hypothetical protein [Kineosporia sp. R_H_3]
MYRLTMGRSADASVRRCELDVLAHWYGDTEQLLDEAYGGYADQTAFLAVERDDGLVVGVSRVIIPGGRGLKTLADIGSPPWSVDAPRAVSAAGLDPDHTWDIATITVRRELGAAGRVVAGALYYGLINGTRVNDCSWIVAIIDRRARSLLSMVGLPLHAIPGTAPELYMGSPACAPVYAHMPTLVDMQRASDPEAHRLITLGHGLTDVLLPDDEGLALDTRDVVDLSAAESSSSEVKNV